MHKRKVIALLGAIGLLSLAILGGKTPKVAQAIEPKNISVFPASDANTNRSQKPPGNAPKGAIVSSQTITKEWLTHEARKMNRIDSNPKATLENLKRAALEATPADTTILVQTVTDPNAGENERTIALHLLVLSPNTASEDFYKIASMHEEPSGNTYHDQFISVLAIAALEQIQNRALENPSLQGDIQRLSEQSKDLQVRAMAKDMLAAVRQGKLIRAEVR